MEAVLAKKFGNRGLNQMSAVEYRRRLLVPGLHTDGGGLYLKVGKKPGHASWISIFHFGQRRREIGLGSTDTVTLARAREKAREVREMVDRGIDPIDAKRAARSVKTFGEVADDWIAAQTPNVKSDKSIARWRRAIGPGGYSDALRKKPADAVTTEDVLAVLRPIWHSKATTARTVRTYIEAVLDAAKAHKLRAGDNPAAWRGNLEPLLGAPKRSTEGHAAVPWRTLPAFMVELRNREALAASLLDFIMLTAARTTEAREATWDEIDFERNVWTVPAVRMKSSAEHSIPLSSGALAILRRLRPAKCKADAFIFGGAKPLSNAAAAMLMRRLGRTETVHGTARSGFRDWAGSATDYPRELAEEALAHAVGDATERAYRRESALERRRPMMEDYCRFLGSEIKSGEQPLTAPAAPPATRARRKAAANPLQTSLLETAE